MKKGSSAPNNATAQVRELLAPELIGAHLHQGKVRFTLKAHGYPLTITPSRLDEMMRQAGVVYCSGALARVQENLARACAFLIPDQALESGEESGPSLNLEL